MMGAALGLALAAVLAGPGAAWAQTGTTETTPATPPPIGLPPGPESFTVEAEPRPSPNLQDLVDDLRTGERFLGWRVIPSLVVGGGYDSNLFGSSSEQRESDVFGAGSVEVLVGYLTERAELAATAGIDGILFADHSDESGVDGGRVLLSGRYQATPRFSLGVNTSFRQGESTIRIFEDTGVEALNVGRQNALALVISPWASYQIDPRTSVGGSYSYTRTEVEDGPGDDEHVFSLGVSRQVSPRDQLSLAYDLRLFSEHGGDSTTAHTVRAGWERALTASTTIRLGVGPRFSEGDVDADASADLDHRFRGGSASLSYRRAQSLVVGIQGSRTTNDGIARVRIEPWRGLQLILDGRLSVIEANEEAGDTENTTIYSVGLTASYPLRSWLTLRAGYRFSYEDGPIDIPRHVVVGSLVFSYPLPIR